MELNELKPCPFCGGKASLKHYIKSVGFNMSDTLCLVECNICRMRGKAFGWIDADTEKEREEMAVNAWNRRANDGN